MFKTKSIITIDDISFSEINFEFNSKIQAPNGELLKPYLIGALALNSYRLMVDIQQTPVAVGSLVLLDDNHINIQYPENHGSALRLTGIDNLFHHKPENQQYKNVGTALMEYVLQESLKSYNGCITLDAIMDAKLFFEKYFFKVHQAATINEFKNRPEAERSMWCMYLPPENIRLLQEKLSKPTVLKKFPTYTLLDATEAQQTLILAKGGKLLSSNMEALSKDICFTIDPALLKQNQNGGIRDSLGLFRCTFNTAKFENKMAKPQIEQMLQRKIQVLKLRLAHVTIEIDTPTENGLPRYLLTGSLKLKTLVEKLDKAGTFDEITAWQKANYIPTLLEKPLLTANARHKAATTQNGASATVTDATTHSSAKIEPPK